MGLPGLSSGGCSPPRLRYTAPSRYSSVVPEPITLCGGMPYLLRHHPDQSRPPAEQIYTSNPPASSRVTSSRIAVSKNSRTAAANASTVIPSWASVTAFNGCCPRAWFALTERGRHVRNG
jgi:hypothetical protein